MFLLIEVRICAIQDNYEIFYATDYKVQILSLFFLVKKSNQKRQGKTKCSAGFASPRFFTFYMFQLLVTYLIKICMMVIIYYCTLNLNVMVPNCSSSAPASELNLDFNALCSARFIKYWSVVVLPFC